MKIALLGSYPLYQFASELGIDPKKLKRVTSWNQILAEALAKIEGVEVNVITATNQIPKTRDICRDGLHLTYFVAPPKANMLTGFQYTIWSVVRLIRRIQPDVVHGIGTEHWYPLIALLSGAPWVVTVHGMISRVVEMTPTPLLSLRRVFAFVEKQVMQRAGHIISINPVVDQFAGPYTQGHFHRVENPVNPLFLEVHAQPETSQEIVYVGDICARKDLHTLVDAFHLVWQMDKRVRLSIAGPPSEKEYARSVSEKIDSLGLHDAIRFLGFVLPDELVSFYGRGALLVLTSLEETAPMCISEAMCCGLPVVSTAAGGVRHMIQQDKTGFVTEIGDVKALADAMMKLMRDPNRRQQMGKAAQQEARRTYDPERIARKTAEIYQMVLAERARGKIIDGCGS